MLADPNKEIRAQCFHVLQEFLREICGAPDVSYAPIVHVLVQHASSQDKFSRLTAITWLHTLVSHGREKLLPFCAQCLNAILASLAHPEDEIKEAANRADGTLRSLVQSASDAHYEMHTVIGALSAHLASQHVGTLVATLGWVHMLLRKSASRVMQLSSQIWPALLKCLSNASEEVCRLDIEAIAYMASSTQQHFAPFIDHLLKLFREDRGLLEARGTVIVRQLCDLLEPRMVFVSLASALHQEDDLEFASQMVHVLSLILLTAGEAWELRMLLKQAPTTGTGTAEEGAELFTTLYPAWAHNPVALLAMCLLAGAHEHASDLVLQFGALEMSVKFLVQIDRLVQLFESPILTHVRLLLLEPEQHPHLLKALWGVLMLLPQSPAYHLLKNRLTSVAELGLLRLQLQTTRDAAGSKASSSGKAVSASSTVGSKGIDGAAGASSTIDFRKLLKMYEELQAKHARLAYKRRQLHGGDANRQKRNPEGSHAPPPNPEAELQTTPF